MKLSESEFCAIKLGDIVLDTLRNLATISRVQTRDETRNNTIDAIKLNFANRISIDLFFAFRILPSNSHLKISLSQNLFIQLSADRTRTTIQWTTMQ